MEDKIPEDVKQKILDYADCRDRKDAVISDCIFGYSLAASIPTEKEAEGGWNKDELIADFVFEVARFWKEFKPYSEVLLQVRLWLNDSNKYKSQSPKPGESQSTKKMEE